ncbi:uncharacterized protein HaLaN_25559 [Haematococcus lacustris]|uniref:Thylakoid lumenal 17.4 kDa protein, chloroplastic n=1 Tax=Haematococcus lacustris TaxID=44745 RepID=A0A699ZX47_HAELA|nr:uncharacterized protein HaLaN_25559 [Haematococcus lacustris]
MAMLRKQLQSARPAPSRSMTAIRCRGAPEKAVFGGAGPLQLMVGVLASGLLTTQVAHAEFRLPPIDPDPKHCERGFVGNTIGQANAVSDKLLDLRRCDFKGANLSAKVLAGALMSESDFTDANLTEAVLTKASVFNNADMTNAVIDRVDFSKASFRGVKLGNAVVTGSSFEGADLTESVWEGALVGGEDVKRLCRNPTLVGESRLEVGCRN